MTDRKAWALSLLIVASVIAGASPSLAVAGTASAAPSGFVGVPSEQITEDTTATYDGPLNASALDGEVRASSNASTLEAIVVSSEMAPKYRNSPVHGGNVITEGDVGLVLRDEVNHAGREIAVPADVIRAQFGYLPEQVIGAHEDGSRWSEPTRVEDGSLIFRVPHFSTQTVSFSSEVRLNGSQATDNTQWLYNVSDEEAVSNVSVNLTGIENTESDTVSAAGLANGDSLALDVAGTDPATSVSVTFTGEGWERVREYTGSDTDTSTSINNTGNLEPSGPANGEPQMDIAVSQQIGEEATSYDTDYKMFGCNDNDGSTIPAETRLDGPPDEIHTLEYEVTSSYGEASNVNHSIYIVEEQPDGTYGEGTLVKSGWQPWGSTGTQTVDISPYSTSASTITVEFVPDSTECSNLADDSMADAIYLGLDSSYSSSYISSGGSLSNYGADMRALSGTPTNLEASVGTASVTYGDVGDGYTSTDPIDFGSGSTSLNWSGSDNGATVDWTLNYTDRQASEDPAIDVDGDGVNDASVTGLLNDSETSTHSLSDLDPGTGPATISLTSGTVTTEVSYVEHSVTQNVEWWINGNATTHSGTLGAGNTTTLNPPDSDVHAGENNVTVRVAQGLSADAPTAQVDALYTHDAERTFSATRDDTKWTESYNVSQTLASNRSSVTATLPFSSDAIEIHDVETRTNGGSWTSVSSSSYVYEGTELTVDTGSAQEGDTVEVRAEARRVVVENGSIEVTDPTVEGDDLDTAIEITNKSAGFAIRTENSSDRRLHYLGTQSWTGTPYAVVDAGAPQEIRMPDASVGSTARVRTLPMSVEPEAGAMEVVVEDASTPQFRLRQGSTRGAENVQIVYNDTVTGESYRLYSVTRDREVDADTAESPVYFWTSGDDETYLIEIKDDTGTAAVAVGGRNTGDGGAGPLPILALVLGIGGAIGGIWLLGRRFGASGARQNTLLIAVGSIVGLVGVEAVTARSIVSDVVFAIGDVLGGFASSGAGAVLITIGLLLLIYLLDRRLGLPPWVQLPAAVLTVLWLLNELTGFLSSALDQLGPLLILLLAGGSILLLWRALKGPTINIRGGSGP